MRLFVTGGAGFIGSCFTHYAIAQGHEVIVFDALTYAGHRENLAGLLPKPGQDEREDFTLVVGDICNGGMVSRLIKEYEVDAIINFAAESHVDNSIASAAPFIQTNIVGTYTLLEAARNYVEGLKGKKKNAFRYIQISTDEVYGSLGKTGKFRETSRYKPSSPYSSSKASADHLVHAWYHTYKLPTIITNCSNNYGPRQHPEKLIPHMITCALDGKPLPVYGDGKNVRDWIHVEDHCHGIYLALTKGKVGQTYLFGGNAEQENIQIIHIICDVLDTLHPHADGLSYKEQITFVTDRAGHDKRYAINNKKAEEKLGFTHNHDFESGLKATIEWYLANPTWIQTVLEKPQKVA